MTVFTSKANTLARLRPLITSAKILPQYAFTVADWSTKPEEILQRIRAEFTRVPVIVRSSAQLEDGSIQSCAGRYVSVPGVDSRDAGGLRASVQQVVDSYGEAAREDQILVQPYLEDVAMSGVVFTRDLDTLAPYYVFNYDEHSRRTDTVTSGTGRGLRTLVHSRFSPLDIPHPRLRRVHQAVRELEELLGCDALDVEFAVTTSEELYIFQARPLSTGGTAPSAVPDAEVKRCLERIERKLEELTQPHPCLYGARSVFGIMPDWNPAEIIGVRPRRLALSLYKELVTDAIWAYQRDNYGYRNLRSFPLIVTFAGLPYIDVRVSFNSFVPADLQDGIAERLVNWYIDRLVAMPASHDKVEFDIVFSCYTFDLDERLEALASTFSYWELGDLRSALRRLTNRIIDPHAGLYRADLQKIAVLEQRRPRILESQLDPIGKIYWLLEDCKRYGTLPFAGLARAAFIAVQLLRSLVTSGVITQQELDRCLASMNTVARRLNRDLSRVRRGQLSRQEFLAQYGHLRPGTYDILSTRYDEDPDRYIGPPDDDAEVPPEPEPFLFSEQQRPPIERSLKQHGIAIDPHGLMQFIREAIEGREYSKFVFSKHLSEAIRLFSRLGQDLGYRDEDLSYVDITTVLKLYSAATVPDLRTILDREIADGRAMYNVTKRLKLPPLICDAADLFSFELEDGSPNYVTLGRVAAEVVSGDRITTQTIPGRIVMIESADPGYDWILANRLVGLITMYGGTNSHMAIRTAELGIPAVIGCGESLFRRWSLARMLEIDAANKQVRILR